MTFELRDVSSGLHLHVYLHVHLYLHIHLYLCTHTIQLFLHIHIHLFLHIQIYTHKHIHIHIHIHLHLHLHMCVHKYTETCAVLSFVKGINHTTHTTNRQRPCTTTLKMKKELPTCHSSMCRDLVSFPVLSRIKLQAPLLVVPFRQSLHVSDERPCSSQNPQT